MGGREGWGEGWNAARWQEEEKFRRQACLAERATPHQQHTPSTPLLRSPSLPTSSPSPPADP